MLHTPGCSPRLPYLLGISQKDVYMHVLILSPMIFSFSRAGIKQVCFFLFSSSFFLSEAAGTLSIGADPRVKFLIRFCISLLLFSTTFPSQGHAQQRTISFYNAHTSEHIRVSYRKYGGYDPQAMAEIDYIFRDWRSGEVVHIDPRLIDLAYDVHALSGSRKPIHILSGYRSPATNAALRRRSKNVAKQSRHMLGQALDMRLPDVPAHTLREIALKLQRGGVGYYRQGFIHLDIGRVRHWPRMSRRELVRLFPDGNTLHIPADGRPLQPGRQLRRVALRDDHEHDHPVEIIPAPTLVAQILPAPAVVSLASPHLVQAPPMLPPMHFPENQGKHFQRTGSMLHAPEVHLAMGKGNSRPPHNQRKGLANQRTPFSYLQPSSFRFSEKKWQIPEAQTLLTAHPVSSQDFVQFMLFYYPDPGQFLFPVTLPKNSDPL